MLDQRERCHGFEHRDFYFLTFAGSFPVKQRRRRRMNRHGVRPGRFHDRLSSPPTGSWSETDFIRRRNR
jgi:hypothetical protein